MQPNLFYYRAGHRWRATDEPHSAPRGVRVWAASEVCVRRRWWLWGALLVVPKCARGRRG